MIRLTSIDYPPTPDGRDIGPIGPPAAFRGHAPGERSPAAATVLGFGKREQPLRVGPGVETVFGTDDRQRILETALAPWRMICALKIDSPLGPFAGTGWLAGPCTVITAGHCVFHRGDMGGWATQIAVSPGRDEQTTPYSTITATRFSAVDQWVVNLDPDFDVGCIHLDQPVGDQTGWFRTAAKAADDLQDWLVNISGYPADRPPPPDPDAGTEQFFAKNRVLRVSDRRIFYDVDTSGGQSGAPVWIQADANDDPLVIAVHAYGTGGTPSTFDVDANSAPCIIPALQAIIEGWIASSNAAA